MKDKLMNIEKSAQTWGYFSPSHDVPSAKSWHRQWVPSAENAVSAVSKGVKAPFRWMRFLGNRLSKDVIIPVQNEASWIGRRLGATTEP